MFIKKPVDILREACSAEDLDLQGDLDLEGLEDELDDLTGELEEIDDDELPYEEATVPVFELSIQGQPDCFVEADNLAKYMVHNNIFDVKEAVANIERHNGLTEGTLGIIIESDDTMYEMLDEARGSRSKKSRAKLKSSMDVVNGMIKTKGLRVVKRKSKKSGKNRKK